MWITFPYPLMAESGGDGGGGSGSGGSPGEGGEGGNGGEGGGSIMSSGSGGNGQGAGAGGQGGDGDAGSAGGDGGQWLLADGVPGTGDKPEWFNSEKYKTIDAQAKAASELEKKLGPAAELLGVPEGGEYALPSEAPENWEYDAEDPLIKSFQGVAKDLGLSQKAHDRIVQAVAGVMAEQDAAEVQATADAIAQLGTNADARVTQVEQALTKHLGAEAFQKLDAAIGNNVEAFKALERLTGLAIGDAQLATGGGAGAPAITQSDVEAEQYKRYPEGHNLAGQLMYDHDKAHREKVDAMWKRLKPGEDRQTVG